MTVISKYLHFLCSWRFSSVCLDSAVLWKLLPLLNVRVLEYKETRISQYHSLKAGNSNIKVVLFQPTRKLWKQMKNRNEKANGKRETINVGFSQAQICSFFGCSCLKTMTVKNNCILYTAYYVQLFCKRLCQFIKFNTREWQRSI